MKQLYSKTPTVSVSVSSGRPDDLTLRGATMKNRVPGYSFRHPATRSRCPGSRSRRSCRWRLVSAPRLRFSAWSTRFCLDPYPYKDAEPHDSHATDHARRAVAGISGSHRAQWQQVRKSPVVEDSFLQGSRNMTIGGSDLPEGCSRRRSDCELFQLSRAFRWRWDDRSSRRMRRWPGSTASGRAGIQVLAATFQRRSQRSGQNDPTGSSELHDRRRGRTALCLGRRRCISSAESYGRPD